MAVDPEAARARLHDEQERVEGLIDELRDELGQPESEGGSTISDPADSGSETFEREKDLAILEQLEAELAELQAALERVDAGTYGIDEVSGEPIDPARLDAIPTARTNVPRQRPDRSDAR
jgi:RNA polymerase-binding transcription factor DksA